MRDGEIIANVKTLNRKIAMLYKQNVFSECRMRALESVMTSSSLWQRLTWLLSPSLYIKLVDTVQFKLMQDHDEELRRQATEAAKPKIVAPTPAQQVVLNGR
jgi:hypothetical protein